MGDLKILDKFDFRKFIQRIYILKPAKDVYNMWAKNESIEKWYVQYASYHSAEGSLKNKKDDFQKDDEYEWAWIDGARLNGRIIEADGIENIKFTFGMDVFVSVNIKDVSGRTLVELIQEQNMNDREMKFNNYMACFPGWSFFLINLKSVCEGGPDLREKSPDVDFLVNI